MRVPTAFTPVGLDKMVGPMQLPSDAAFPSSTFTSALERKGRHDVPQTIAHRGYRAKYPENTIASFAAAIDVGAHAIETDVHITRDEVVVLSHDSTLSRCFGVDKKIIDCDWEFIKPLQTAPPLCQGMPRLIDLLEYISQPGVEDIWILLDIKMDNDSEKIFRLVAQTLESMPAASRPWTERIVLGCWTAKYLPLASKYLPGYPISHIGFSTQYCRRSLVVPNIGFSMLFDVLPGPGGKSFLKTCKDEARSTFAYTVNKPDKMEWCIRRRLDGVITDDPEKFRKFCEEFDESKPEAWLSITVVLRSLRIWVLTALFGTLYYSKIDKVSPADAVLKDAGVQK